MPKNETSPLATGSLQDSQTTYSVPPRMHLGTAGEMAYWLQGAMGTGRLSGYFRRGDSIVYTPRIGDDGYRQAAEGQDDGPAQVRVATPDTLRSRVQYAHAWYRPVRDRKTGEPKRDRNGNEITVPALFPLPAAQTALGAPDALGSVRVLRGITHTPMVRRDGTILAEPGYDEATGHLYLPDTDLNVPEVSVAPSAAELAQAMALLDEMVAGFPWAGKHDKANYYGLLLTPLLRLITPPAYKLFAINAHQPASGKTLLANLVRRIHGGVFRTEMPMEDAEIQKVLTTILYTTSAPVVVVDNVTGSLKSGALAGLLTSRDYSERLLGTNEAPSLTNDRVWTITGNNVQIGGDLGRRTITVAIDPGRPNPEERVAGQDFAIADLEGWAKANRGRLLWALLTMVASWVAADRPLQARDQSDSYTRWEATVGGILEHAGVTGSFDHKESRNVRGDDEEIGWRDFLVAVRGVFGAEPFYVTALAAKIRQGTPGSPVMEGTDAEAFSDKLSPSVLPLAKLEDQARRGLLTVKSLGNYLANRKGRWYGDHCIEQAGDRDRKHGQAWRIRNTSDPRESR